jgi:hypothetical protein
MTKKIDGSQYVACDEVKNYLTELQKCLRHVADGIGTSMEAMDEKMKLRQEEKGKLDDDSK